MKPVVIAALVLMLTGCDCGVRVRAGVDAGETSDASSELDTGVGLDGGAPLDARGMLDASADSALLPRRRGAR